MQQMRYRQLLHQRGTQQPEAARRGSAQSVDSLRVEAQAAPLARRRALVAENVLAHRLDGSSVGINRGGAAGGRRSSSSGGNGGRRIGGGCGGGGGGSS